MSNLDIIQSTLTKIAISYTNSLDLEYLLYTYGYWLVLEALWTVQAQHCWIFFSYTATLQLFESDVYDCYGRASNIPKIRVLHSFSFSMICMLYIAYLMKRKRRKLNFGQFSIILSFINALPFQRNRFQLRYFLTK